MPEDEEEGFIQVSEEEKKDENGMDQRNVKEEYQSEWGHARTTPDDENFSTCPEELCMLKSFIIFPCNLCKVVRGMVKITLRRIINNIT